MHRPVWIWIGERAAIMLTVPIAALLIAQAVFVGSTFLSFLAMGILFALLYNIHARRQERLGAARILAPDATDFSPLPLAEFLHGHPEVRGTQWEIVAVRHARGNEAPSGDAVVIVEHKSPREYVQMGIIAGAYWATATLGWFVWFTWQGDAAALAGAASAAFVLSIFTIPALLLGMALKLEPPSLLTLALLAGILHMGILAQPEANADSVAAKLLSDYPAAAVVLGWLPAVSVAITAEQWSAHWLGMRQVFPVTLASSRSLGP